MISIQNDFLQINYPKVINIINCKSVEHLNSTHLFPSIYYVKTGSLTVVSSDNHLVLQEGMFFFISGNTLVTAHSDDSLSLIGIFFFENSPSFESLFSIQQSIQELHSTNTSETTNRFLDIGKDYHTFMATKQLKDKMYLDAKFVEILSFLVSSQIKQKEENITDKDMQRVIDYFGDNYASPIKMAEVASMIGLHPNYFSRKFKECYGISPKKFLTSIRLKKAGILMKSTTLTLKEISRAVGYDDYLAFYKAFKQLNQDLTPSSFME